MSNPLRKMFETDQSVEREGIWLEYAPGVEIKIARAGGSNKRFAKILSRLAKPHRRSIQTDTINGDVLRKMFISAYAQAVVLDWRGITTDILTKNEDDAGTDLPCNQENVEAVLEALPDLFADIQKASDNIALFRAEILEEDSKN